MLMNKRWTNLLNGQGWRWYGIGVNLQKVVGFFFTCCLKTWIPCKGRTKMTALHLNYASVALNWQACSDPPLHVQEQVLKLSKSGCVAIREREFICKYHKFLDSPQETWYSVLNTKYTQLYNKDNFVVNLALTLWWPPTLVQTGAYERSWDSFCTRCLVTAYVVISSAK